MKNVSHKKNWNLGTIQVHVDPPPVPLVKRNTNEKLDKDCVKVKLHRYPTSEKSNLYKFKISLFDNGKPE